MTNKSYLPVQRRDYNSTSFADATRDVFASKPVEHYIISILETSPKDIPSAIRPESTHSQRLYAIEQVFSSRGKSLPSFFKPFGVKL